jgi:hypothetical protein
MVELGYTYMLLDFFHLVKKRGDEMMSESTRRDFMVRGKGYVCMYVGPCPGSGPSVSGVGERVGRC